MSIEERAQKAVTLKTSGYNCTQAVLKAYEEDMGVDIGDALKLGAGFGAGMGSMEATCGALVGAVMVAGALTDGEKTIAIAKKILQNFESRSGATLCKDLKGRDTGKLLCSCNDCVKNAVLALGEVME